MICTNENTKKTVALAALLVAVLLSGCASTNSSIDQVRIPDTPKYINAPSRTAVPVQTSDGSLYVDGNRHGQINDFRAYDINDLVQISIVESTTASNNAALNTARDDSNSRSLSSLLGLADRLLPKVVDPSNVIQSSTDDEFEGNGTNSRAETIRSVLSARVVDRLPNGNLIVQAVREIIVSGERQVMVVSGIIRPVDIDDTNSIPSTKIADLQIQYGGTGSVSDTLRRGWFSKALSYIWPL